MYVGEDRAVPTDQQESVASASISNSFSLKKLMQKLKQKNMQKLVINMPPTPQKTLGDRMCLLTSMPGSSPSVTMWPWAPAL